jgi:AraC-like DNA-binding protein
MEPVIHSSYGTLELHPYLPNNWTGGILSGGQAYTYEGQLGRVTLQQFHDQKFSICYAVTNFLQKIKLFWNEQPVLRLQYVLDGKLRYKIKRNKSIQLNSGQLNGVWQPGRVTEAHLEKGKFEIFQFAVQPEFVQELIPHFPQAKAFPSETARQWIGEERQKDIYEILNAPYTDFARRFFYETKVREHLLAFSLPVAQERDIHFSEEEIERIYSVDRKILEDLSKHHSTEDLARFARMPEAKLNALFKDIIGVSMFERYKEAKLQKARKYLLETDIQVKVMYEMVGYESYTGFVEAFKERFGLSPLRYRKKFRPFD